MWPTLFGAPAHVILLSLGVAVGAAAMLAAARRHGISPDLRLAEFLVAAAVVSLLGAKIESWVERGGVEIRLTELWQGYRYPGAMVALIVLVAAWWRFGASTKTLFAWADCLAPAAAFGLSVVRIGCFMAGCCHGAVSGSPWAVSFPIRSYAWYAHVSVGLIRADAPTSLPVHPLQLFFAAWALLLGCYLVWLIPRRSYPGQVSLIYLLLDNIAKFLFEGLRDPPVPRLRWMSLTLAAFALVVLLLARYRRASVPRSTPMAANPVSESAVRLTAP